MSDTKKPTFTYLKIICSPNFLNKICSQLTLCFFKGGSPFFSEHFAKYWRKITWIRNIANFGTKVQKIENLKYEFDIKTGKINNFYPINHWVIQTIFFSWRGVNWQVFMLGNKWFFRPFSSFDPVFRVYVYKQHQYSKWTLGVWKLWITFENWFFR